jgi:DNA repair protein RecN (Recombination protein N)
MPRARFEVALHPQEPPPGAPCGPGGAEQVEFLFSANAGEAPRSFRRVVSGGELSRAFLALRNALRDSARGMVLVFDEVDAGVGGRAADRVGRILSELAAHHQVLCITHLPQIAAFADVHFRVDKAARGGRTRARIERVEGDARVEEIARMAGGEKVGEATRRHARDLLSSRRP